MDISSSSLQTYARCYGDMLHGLAVFSSLANDGDFVVELNAGSEDSAWRLQCELVKFIVEKRYSDAARCLSDVIKHEIQVNTRQNQSTSLFLSAMYGSSSTAVPR